ncbi:MAG: VWA domain-containing protein, partial [Oscillospiraceae bacterium]
MKFKRLLSGFLAALTIVGTAPTMAFAADGNGSPGVEVTGNSHISTPVGNAEDYPSIGNDGYVQMKKSAQWTNTEKTTAEITFDVYGTGIPTGSDAILVMDRSGSMGECGGTEFTKINGRWQCNKCGDRRKNKPEICDNDVSTNNRMTAAKSAANSFIDTMFKSNLDGTKSQNQVALVSFSSNATLKSGFQDVDGQATLKSKVAGLVADGGTNYTNAFKEVIELLKDRPEGSPPVSIVFLTDGEPNSPGIFEGPTDGKKEASALKVAPYNCTIYTIGCGLSKDGASNLVTIASPDCAFDAKAPEGLTAIFTKIAGSIQKAGTNAIINDMISEYFEFDDNKTMTAGQGEAQKNGDSITWNLGDIPTTVTTLTIPIKLKAEYDKDGVYPTNNGKATLDYNNPDQAARKQEVETPQLARPLAAAEIVYFLTNDKGEAVDGNGKVLNEQEFKLTRVELKREFKSNLAVGTHEITAADTITSGGKTYKLMPNADFGNKSPYNLKVEDDNSAYTVFFGYSEVSKVKLTFDNNTEEVTTPQDTTWNDVTANLPIKNQPLESQKTLPTMTRAHYTFNGWALDKEGKTAFTTESSIDKDTTVYAQWTENSSSNAAVRYDANNAEYKGSVPTDNNKYYLEDDVTVSAEKLSGVTNYTFKGWSTDKSATTPMTETSVKMANLTTG